MGIQAGLDRYNYVENSPLSYRDPRGLIKTCGVPDCCSQAPAPAKLGGGTIMCCNGQKTVCLFNQYPGPQGDMIRDCKRRHEEKHFEDVDCSGTGTYQPGFGPRRPQAVGECEAYQVEIDCLGQAIKKCGNNGQCVDWMKRTIESLHSSAEEKGFGCVFR